MHVTSQLGAVGKDGVIAHMTVMCQMHVGHDPVVIAQLGHARIAGRANVKSAKLTDGVAVANYQLARLAAVFFVLGNGPERVELKDAVVTAYGGVRLHPAQSKSQMDL